MSKSAILSPLPGTFYRRPAPDQPPFKADGDAIEVGDVLGLVEVMKNFHEVTAELAGSNLRFTIDDGDAIMAGQGIAEIDT